MTYKFYVSESNSHCVNVLQTHVHPDCCVNHVSQADFVVGDLWTHLNQLPRDHFQKNAQVLPLYMQMWDSASWLELIKKKYRDIPGLRVCPHAFVENTLEFAKFCEVFDEMVFDLVETSGPQSQVLATNVWSELKNLAPVLGYHHSSTLNRVLFGANHKLHVQMHVPLEKLCRIHGIYAVKDTQVYCVSNTTTRLEKNILVQLLNKLYTRYTGFFDITWYEELGYYHLHSFTSICASDLITPMFLDNDHVTMLLRYQDA